MMPAIPTENINRYPRRPPWRPLRDGSVAAAILEQSPPRAKMFEIPLVYVAGPYTRPDPIRNTHDAVKWGERINASGLACAMVPHITLLWHAIAPHDDVEYWYALDIAHLARCDAVFRFPGDSSGADREVAFALSRDLPVFTDFDQLLDWARDRG